MSRVLLGPAASAVTQSPWGDLGPAAPIPAAPIPTLARLRRLLALPKSRDPARRTVCEAGWTLLDLCQYLYHPALAAQLHTAVRACVRALSTPGSDAETARLTLRVAAALAATPAVAKPATATNCSNSGSSSSHSCSDCSNTLSGHSANSGDATMYPFPRVFLSPTDAPAPCCHADVAMDAAVSASGNGGAAYGPYQRPLLAGPHGAVAAALTGSVSSVSSSSSFSARVNVSSSTSSAVGSVPAATANAAVSTSHSVGSDAVASARRVFLLTVAEHNNCNIALPSTNTHHIYSSSSSDCGHAHSHSQSHARLVLAPAPLIACHCGTASLAVDDLLRWATVNNNDTHNSAADRSSHRDSAGAAAGGGAAYDCYDTDDGYGLSLDNDDVAAAALNHTAATTTTSSSAAGNAPTADTHSATAHSPPQWLFELMTSLDIDAGLRRTTPGCSFPSDTLGGLSSPQSLSPSADGTASAAVLAAAVISEAGVAVGAALRQRVFRARAGALASALAAAASLGCEFDHRSEALIEEAEAEAEADVEAMPLPVRNINAHNNSTVAGATNNGFNRTDRSTSSSEASVAGVAAGVSTTSDRGLTVGTVEVREYALTPLPSATSNSNSSHTAASASASFASGSNAHQAQNAINASPNTDSSASSSSHTASKDPYPYLFPWPLPFPAPLFGMKNTSNTRRPQASAPQAAAPLTRETKAASATNSDGKKADSVQRPGQKSSLSAGSGRGLGPSRSPSHSRSSTSYLSDPPVLPPAQWWSRPLSSSSLPPSKAAASANPEPVLLPPWPLPCPPSPYLAYLFAASQHAELYKARELSLERRAAALTAEAAALTREINAALTAEAHADSDADSDNIKDAVNHTIDGDGITADGDEAFPRSDMALTQSSSNTAAYTAAATETAAAAAAASAPSTLRRKSRRARRLRAAASAALATAAALPRLSLQLPYVPAAIPLTSWLPALVSAREHDILHLCEDRSRAIFSEPPLAGPPPVHSHHAYSAVYRRAGAARAPARFPLPLPPAPPQVPTLHLPLYGGPLATGPGDGSGHWGAWGVGSWAGRGGAGVGAGAGAGGPGAGGDSAAEAVYQRALRAQNQLLLQESALKARAAAAAAVSSARDADSAAATMAEASAESRASVNASAQSTDLSPPNALALRRLPLLPPPPLPPTVAEAAAIDAAAAAAAEADGVWEAASVGLWSGYWHWVQVEPAAVDSVCDSGSLATSSDCSVGTGAGKLVMCRVPVPPQPPQPSLVNALGEVAVSVWGDAEGAVGDVAAPTAAVSKVATAAVSPANKSVAVSTRASTTASSSFTVASPTSASSTLALSVSHNSRHASANIKDNAASSGLDTEQPLHAQSVHSRNESDDTQTMTLTMSEAITLSYPQHVPVLSSTSTLAAQSLSCSPVCADCLSRPIVLPRAPTAPPCCLRRLSNFASFLLRWGRYRSLAATQAIHSAGSGNAHAAVAAAAAAAAPCRAAAHISALVLAEAAESARQVDAPDDGGDSALQLPQPHSALALNAGQTPPGVVLQMAQREIQFFDVLRAYDPDLLSVPTFMATRVVAVARATAVLQSHLVAHAPAQAPVCENGFPSAVAAAVASAAFTAASVAGATSGGFLMQTVPRAPLPVPVAFARTPAPLLSIAQPQRMHAISTSRALNSCIELALKHNDSLQHLSPASKSLTSYQSQGQRSQQLTFAYFFPPAVPMHSNGEPAPPSPHQPLPTASAVTIAAHRDGWWWRRSASALAVDAEACALHDALLLGSRTEKIVSVSSRLAGSVGQVEGAARALLAEAAPLLALLPAEVRAAVEEWGGGALVMPQSQENDASTVDGVNSDLSVMAGFVPGMQSPLRWVAPVAYTVTATTFNAFRSTDSGSIVSASLTQDSVGTSSALPVSPLDAARAILAPVALPPPYSYPAPPAITSITANVSANAGSGAQSLIAGTLATHAHAVEALAHIRLACPGATATAPTLPQPRDPSNSRASRVNAHSNTSSPAAARSVSAAADVRENEGPWWSRAVAPHPLVAPHADEPDHIAFQHLCGIRGWALWPACEPVPFTASSSASVSVSTPLALTQSSSNTRSLATPEASVVTIDAVTAARELLGALPQTAPPSLRVLAAATVAVRLWLVPGLQRWRALRGTALPGAATVIAPATPVALLPPTALPSTNTSVASTPTVSTAVVDLSKPATRSVAAVTSAAAAVAATVSACVSSLAISRFGPLRSQALALLDELVAVTVAHQDAAENASVNGPNNNMTRSLTDSISPVEAGEVDSVGPPSWWMTVGAQARQLAPLPEVVATLAQCQQEDVTAWVRRVIAGDAEEGANNAASAADGAKGSGRGKRDKKGKGGKAPRADDENNDDDSADDGDSDDGDGNDDDDDDDHEEAEVLWTDVNDADVTALFAHSSSEDDDDADDDVNAALSNDASVDAKNKKATEQPLDAKSARRRRRDRRRARATAVIALAAGSSLPLMTPQPQSSRSSASATRSRERERERERRRRDRERERERRAGLPAAAVAMLKQWDTEMRSLEAAQRWNTYESQHAPSASLGQNQQQQQQRQQGQGGAQTRWSLMEALLTHWDLVSNLLYFTTNTRLPTYAQSDQPQHRTRTRRGARNPYRARLASPEGLVRAAARRLNSAADNAILMALVRRPAPANGTSGPSAPGARCDTQYSNWNKIGHGAFGDVYSATYKPLPAVANVNVPALTQTRSSLAGKSGKGAKGGKGGSSVNSGNTSRSVSRVHNNNPATTASSIDASSPIVAVATTPAQDGRSSVTVTLAPFASAPVGTTPSVVASTTLGDTDAAAISTAAAASADAESGNASSKPSQKTSLWSRIFSFSRSRANTESTAEGAAANADAALSTTAIAESSAENALVKVPTDPMLTLVPGTDEDAMVDAGAEHNPTCVGSNNNSKRAEPSAVAACFVEESLAVDDAGAPAAVVPLAVAMALETGIHASHEPAAKPVTDSKTSDVRAADPHAGCEDDGAVRRDPEAGTAADFNSMPNSPAVIDPASPGADAESAVAATQQAVPEPTVAASDASKESDDVIASASASASAEQERESEEEDGGVLYNPFEPESPALAAGKPCDEDDIDNEEDGSNEDDGGDDESDTVQQQNTGDTSAATHSNSVSRYGITSLFTSLSSLFSPSNNNNNTTGMMLPPPADGTTLATSPSVSETRPAPASSPALPADGAAATAPTVVVAVAPAGVKKARKRDRTRGNNGSGSVSRTSRPLASDSSNNNFASGSLTAVAAAESASLSPATPAVGTATESLVAIKQVDLASADSWHSGTREILTLLSGPHPNLVACRDVYAQDNALWIVMELCSGGPLSRLLQRARLPERSAIYVVREVLLGLAFLHSKGRIHRDVKPANILLHADGRVCLGDLGLVTEDDREVPRTALAGTCNYMSPEMVMGVGYTAKTDIWSIGCTLIEALEGHPPYKFVSQMTCLFRMALEPAPRLAQPEWVSPLMNHFLARCLEKDPRARATAEELLAHPIMAYAADKNEFMGSMRQAFYDKALRAAGWI